MEIIDRTFHCPDIDSQASAIAVKQVLLDTPGVMDAEVTLNTKTVMVRLRDLAGESTVRRHLSNAGFPPED